MFRSCVLHRLKTGAPWVALVSLALLTGLTACNVAQPASNGGTPSGNDNAAQPDGADSPIDPNSTYGQFSFGSSGSASVAKTSVAGQASEEQAAEQVIEGVIEGVDVDTFQLMLIADDGEQKILDIDADGSSTELRYSTTASLFAYRTPPNPQTVTTSAATYAISMMTPGTDGHSSNPIVYPDASTKGDIVLQAVPPRFDVSSATGVMHGTMMWRGDVFYYDVSGNQIGSVLTTSVSANYAGTSNPTVTIAESILDKTPTRSDMDGDGMDDFFNRGTDSSAIAAYKIDITALPVSSQDNTGIFVYFVTKSEAASFAGFS